MDAIQKRNVALARLNVLLDGNKKVLRNFKQDIEEDMVGAFSWGDDAVRAAVCCKHICRSIESLRDNPHAGVEPRIEFYQKEVFRAGRTMHSSTSAMRNLVAAAELEVMLQLLELFSSIQLYNKKYLTRFEVWCNLNKQREEVTF